MRSDGGGTVEGGAKGAGPLTVLGGAVSEHEPEVGVAHVLNGDGHLE